MVGHRDSVIGLFQGLLENGIISKSHQYNYHKLITIHFINKQDKEFKEKQLSVAKSKLIDNRELYIHIIDIVNELAINRN